MMFLFVLYIPTPTILRLCIALFAVDEGWRLLDMKWFVLFFIRYKFIAISITEQLIENVLEKNKLTHLEQIEMYTRFL